MDRRAHYAGRIFAGVYTVGVLVAVIGAPMAELRPVRFYLAGLPWSMISFGLGFGLPPTVLGWLLMALSVLLNALIAYAWGALFFDRRSPSSAKRAI